MVRGPGRPGPLAPVERGGQVLEVVVPGGKVVQTRRVVAVDLAGEPQGRRVGGRRLQVEAHAAVRAFECVLGDAFAVPRGDAARVGPPGAEPPQRDRPAEPWFEHIGGGQPPRQSRRGGHRLPDLLHGVGKRDREVQGVGVTLGPARTGRDGCGGCRGLGGVAGFGHTSRLARPRASRTLGRRDPCPAPPIHSVRPPVRRRPTACDSRHKGSAVGGCPGVRRRRRSACR